jgi:hypothetical protein
MQEQKTAKPKSAREYLAALVWDGKAQLARWFHGLAIRLDPGLHDEVSSPQYPPRVADPIVDVVHSPQYPRDPIVDVIHSPQYPRDPIVDVLHSPQYPRDPIVDVIHSPQYPRDPIVDVLHRALGNCTGKLRVADAFLIGGIEPGKANQDQISRFGRAIRELGWERQRRRFDGSLQYAYVKGTAAEREVELRIEIDNNGQPPTTN